MNLRFWSWLWVFAVLLSHLPTVNAQITITSAPSTACLFSPISIAYNSVQAGTLYVYLYNSGTADYGSPKQMQTISTGSSLTVTIPGSQIAGQSIIRLTNSTTGHTVTAPIIINAIPVPPIIANVFAYCQGTVASPLVAIASNGGTLNWYGTSAVGGESSSVSPTPQTSIAGSTTYYVSQIANGCESPKASISVVVRPTPSSPLTSSVTYCQGNPANTLTATGSNLVWYTSPIGGTGSSAAITPRTNTAGIYSYYVSQSINGCESPRAAANVTIHPIPSLTITPSDPIVTPTQTSLTLSAIASTSALTWSTTETVSSIMVSTAGPYSVTALSNNGCRAEASTYVTQLAPGEIYTTKTGDWSEPSVWSSNQIPGNTDPVRIRHSINLPTGFQGHTGLLTYAVGGQLIMQTSSGLKMGL
ncbi:hypothetical protein [Spirosoma sp.]|nr:hypothetical protein [Spirosoma sp.]